MAGLKISVLKLVVIGFLILGIISLKQWQKQWAEGTLGNAEDSAGHLPRKNHTIVFMRTSTEELQWFEICSLYTAATKNPHSTIKLLSNKHLKFPLLLQTQQNLKQEFLNLTEIFLQTPSQRWYESGKWNVTDFVKRVRFLSDAARVAYLYKYGGVYMDTDLWTLRSIENIPDGLARQDPTWLVNTFLAFHTRGHPFLKLAMERHEQIFDPKEREFTFGPAVLTEALKTYDELVKKLDPENTEYWSPLIVYSQELFFPIMDSEHQVLFQTTGNERQDRMKLVDSAYTMHLWRNLVRWKLKKSNLKPEINSIIYQVAKNICPEALKIIAPDNM